MGDGGPEAAAEALRGAGMAALDVLLTLGSGQSDPWAGSERIVLPYAGIPGWQAPGVEGHLGQLGLVETAGTRILVMSGRHHYYETGSHSQMAVPIRTARLLGARVALLVNSAGSLRPALGPGTLVCLSSHILLHPAPCAGPLRAGRAGTERFAYWPAGRELVARAARHRGVPLTGGVLLCVTGPAYETAAEAEMARRMGADIVSMSLAPEALLAAGAGFRVLGLSLVTNMVGPWGAGAGGHTRVVAAAEQAQPLLGGLLREVAPALPALL